MTCSSTYSGGPCPHPATHRISFCCPCGTVSELYPLCDTDAKRVRAGRHDTQHACGRYPHVCEVQGPSSLGGAQTSEASPAPHREEAA
jgi:hypothetical protein